MRTFDVYLRKVYALRVEAASEEEAEAIARETEIGVWDELDDVLEVVEVRVEATAS